MVDKQPQSASTQIRAVLQTLGATVSLCECEEVLWQKTEENPTSVTEA